MALWNVHHNNHNVYILGAGFSVDAGLPVVKDFMQRMRLAYTASSSDTARDIESVLTWRLATASAALRCKIDPDNIEELFSLIAGARGQDGQSRDNKKTMQHAIVDTLVFCSSSNPCLKKTRLLLHKGYKKKISEAYLSDKRVNDRDDQWDLPIYDAMATVLSGSIYPERSDALPQRNTIITFNYDTVIEDAFERIGVKFNLGLNGAANLGVDSDYESNSWEPDDNTTKILKLHGSVNWKLVGRSIVIKKKINSMRQDQSGQYVLEPPTWDKDRNAEILQPLWNASIDSIRFATRIFIIGYSLPEIDMYFKYLIASGLAQNISLESIVFVNPAVNDPVQFDLLSKRVFRIFREELQTNKI